MIAGHATLEIRWDGTSHHATGERQHEVGLSVLDAGRECGVVGRWRFDGETLTVEGESFGYLPIFIHEGKDRVMVGTSPIALVAAGAPGEIDREAVGLFLRIGFYLGERTPFKHIRVAPRGRRFTWSRGRSKAEGPGMAVVPPTVRSVEDGVQGYCDLFRQSMRRRPPTSDRFAMPLSGGRDSRMMLLDSLALGHRPAACVNLGGQGGNHPDSVVARKLADRTGIPLIEVDARGPWIETESRKHVTGGLLVMEHTWMMPLWDALRASFPCWYDGLGAGAITRGDLCKPEFRDHYRKGDWSAFLRDFTACALHIADDTIRRLSGLVDWIEPDVESSIALLREELDCYRGAANPLTAFSFANWGGRAISLNPYMLCAPVRDIHTPFMDADLVRFLLGYPLDLALEDDLQTAAVRRMHPTFADVPFDKDLPKWKRPKRPALAALRNRVASVGRVASRGGTFRSIAIPAAVRGDARLLPFLTVLGFLAEAANAEGARRLLDTYGFGSPADRSALALQRRD